MSGETVIVFDEDGNEEVTSFAKKNERVKKDNSNNSRKVIDKLARKQGLHEQLAVAHAIELISVSEKENRYSYDNKHQWLDENGWEYRTVYIQDNKTREIFSAELNIANTKDGRRILYDINNVKKVDDGVVASAPSNDGVGSPRTSTYTNTIPQSAENSNTDSEKLSVKEGLKEKGGLNKKELSKFYSAAMEDNQNDNLSIGDNGVLIPTETTNDYKLVSYYEDSDGQLRVQSVYKLENYDYNIHDDKPNIANIIIEMENDYGCGEQTIKNVLRDYIKYNEIVFRKYNKQSRRFTLIGRGNAQSEGDIREKTFGEGILSGGREDVNYSRKENAVDVGKLLDENEELQEATQDLKRMLNCGDLLPN